MTTLTPTQISTLESKISSNDISGFYTDLIGFGDEYAVLAKGVTNNDTWQGQLANSFMNSAANGGLPYGSTEWTSLNRDLANAYLQGYKTNANSTPSWDAVQTLHNGTFSLHNLPANAWFPNKILNESGDPAAKWADFMQNLSSADLWEDSFSIMDSGLAAWLSPTTAYDLMTDWNGLRDDLEFAKNFMNALLGLDRARLDQMIDDFTGNAGVSAFLRLVEDMYGQANNALANIADSISNFLAQSYDHFVAGLSDFRDDIASLLHQAGLWIYRKFDPLILDINGDGLNLSSIEDSNAYFNMQDRDFATLNGWTADATDGFLAIDANANGMIDDINELFGDTTQTGFEELATLDSNSSGNITSADAQWNNLRVWIDANSNGVTDNGELYTMAQLGITEFDLDTTADGTDINGNTLVETADFVINSNTYQVGEVLLNVNAASSIYQGIPPEVSPEALSLPYLRGAGIVADTIVAMSLDTTLLAQGQSLAVSATLSNFDTTATNMRALMYRWAGVDGTDPDSRDADYWGAFDARELEFLEHYTGDDFETPVGGVDPDGADQWTRVRETFEHALMHMTARFLVQTDSALQQVVRYDAETDAIALLSEDTSALSAAQPSAGADRALYWAVLALAETPATVAGFEAKDYILTNLRGNEASLSSDQKEFFNIAIGDFEGPAVNWWEGLFESTMYTRPVIDLGGNEGDNVKNPLNPGSDPGNVTFWGGDGNDSAIGGDLSTTFIGGRGNDSYTIVGGDNVLYFREGDGQDTFLYGESNIKVVFGEGITTGDVTYERVGNDLLANISGGDKITWANHFIVLGDGSFTGLTELVFADDTVHTAEYVRSLANIYTTSNTTSEHYSNDLDEVITGSSASNTLWGQDGNDTLTGGSGADELHGEIGNDVMHGGADADYIYDDAGNNTFHGGTGNDSMYSSGDGDDTYLFSDGDGQDSISETNALAYGGGSDKIVFDASVAKVSVWYETPNGLDLRIHYGTGSDYVDVVNFFSSNPLTGTTEIELVQFSDLSTHSLSYIYEQALTQQGTSGVDTLTGISSAGQLGDYANFLYGQGGADSLVGMQGNDLLDGGTGADTLSGNWGDDTYVVDNAGDVITEGAGTDLVRASISYTLGSDLENLTLTGSSNLNATGNTLDNILTGNSGNNTLTASDGNDILEGGAGTDTLVGGIGNDTYIVDTATDVLTEGASAGTDLVLSSATITLATNIEKLTLTGSGNINGTGNTLDNVLTGNSGNNTLSGSGGADTIDGGAGTDTLIGGTGNDTFIVDTATDTITENSAEGTDLVQSSASITLAANVENLTLTGSSNINGTGNSAVNTLTGNSGDNVLDGSTGNDTLIGGAGSDTYVVDSTSDVVTEGASAGTDLVQSSATFTLGVNVENLTLTGGSTVNGTGNTLDNILTGNSGNNILTGSSGADTLEGAAGTDTLVGGTGNDVFIIDSATDTITENAAEGTDTVQSSVTYTLGLNVENLTLTGSGNITGTGNTLANILMANAGTNTLIGGTGNDTYVVDTATDTITENAAEGTDLVQSSATITLAANVENLTLTGSSNINGTGNSAVNILTGNSADNVLDGSTGNDSLIGGTGNDTYVVDSTSDVVTEGAAAGWDLVLAGATFTLGSNVENITLTGASNIHATGNTLDNVITGNSGNNSLAGGDGIDVLDGGSGIDTLVGGAGNDTYIIDTATDVLTESAASGTDIVQSSVSFTLGANFENLMLLGSSNINGTGNTLDNILYGNSGNNTLTGGVGNDTYVVDSVSDVVSELSSQGTDLVQSSVSYTLATNVENMTLTGTSNINATGNTAVNTLTGNSGNNALDGGSGADTLLGGLGDDTYVVDNASDVVTENASEGIDTVQSGVTWTLGSNLENLTLTGASTLNGTGNSLNNNLVGNSGVNILTGGAGHDFLDGGSAADTLIGGTGHDIYAVDNASDVVTENANEGTDTIQSSITWTLGSNLENLTLTGASTINGTGNTLDNALTGNTGVNILTGGAGNDIIDGGTGADTLVGGTGDDTFVIDNASDVVTENSSEGTDSVESSVTWTLGSNVEKLTLTGTSAINGTGNTLDNVITGNSAVNTLTGGSGADTIDGGEGADTLIGGTGNDIFYVDNASDVVTENASEGTDTVQSSVTWTLGSNVENLILTGTANINGTGNTLNNILTGNSGTNTLTGSSGADTIDGGAGADTLIGGTGNDTFIVDNTGDVVSENSAEGTDLVQSSVSYTLASNVENLTLTGFFNINGTGNSSTNVITGNTENNTLWGGSGGDTLSGGDGNDMLYGQDGLDTMTGGAGIDTFVFEAATAYNNIDVISDYNPSARDVIDVSGLLSAYNPLADSLQDFVRIQDSGSNSTLAIDRDGTAGGYTWTQVATLTGITGITDESALVSSGNLRVS